MDLLQHTPALTADAAAEIARELYDLEVSVDRLPGERDQNFLLQTAAGDRFVLKIANGAEERSILEAQNAALEHVASQTTLCPRVIPAANGSTLLEVPSRHGAHHFVRLLTWLPGVTLGSLKRHSPALLEDLGRKIAELDLALIGFDHPAIHRDLYWDLANAFRIVRERSSQIRDEALRVLIERLVARIEEDDSTRFARLRRSAVHNDTNDYNILVEQVGNGYGYNVAGILDFGDMVHSYAIADLAIGVAYAILGKPNPLAAAANVVRGYHAVKALTDEELAALYGLVVLRLCASVSVAATQHAQRPDDPYLAISQGPIQRILPRLERIHPRFAEGVFRRACGKRPVDDRAIVALTDRKDRIESVVGRDIDSVVVLDLSVSSPLVSSQPHENDEPRLARRIRDAMSESGAQIGLGRYGEARLLYSSAQFASEDDEDGERRTIHLGVDLFSAAGSGVHAPLDGVVHAVADNQEPMDYGPVVILRHAIDDAAPFYTLYGHLSRRSLEPLTVGQTIRAGERFAALGAPDENGGWPPHLHFQLILDLLDLDCDFPGVCRASEYDVWSALSPDPNIILRIPALTASQGRHDNTALLARRRRSTGGNVSVSYDDPVQAVRGWMQYLYDVTGRRYLDAYNNVPHVGHCHPRVVAAAAEQMRLLNTNTRYLHDNLVRYAERLAATFPEPLRVCFFVNSGSEANELALRLARAHTRQRGIIVLDAAYHGNTTTAVSISPYKFNGPGGEGAPPWVRTAPIPDVYRHPASGIGHPASDMSQAIESLNGAGHGVAAYIAESAPSVGGQIIFPDGYLSNVYSAVRAAGGVCIADEVQTAFGRLGHSFYAFEAQHVVPDIVVLGKPIGNGHPIGAVVTTPSIAQSFDNGMEFFSTFGGNTVSCAVGLAVLDVVRDEGLQEHARLVGAALLDGLNEIAGRHPIVGDVRGSGLFIGVELVKSRDTLEPATAAARFVVNRLREEGILLGTDGPFANVLKIRPPMPFGQADASTLCRTLDRVLAELAV